MLTKIGENKHADSASDSKSASDRDLDDDRLGNSCPGVTRIRLDDGDNGFTIVGEADDDIPSEQQTRPTEAHDATDSVYEGALLLNKYRLERQLGAGGMGVVYLARETIGGCPVPIQVAVKILRSEYRDDPNVLEALANEVAISRDVLGGHENIAPAYTVEQHRSTIFTVMQYVEGKSLAELLDHDYANGMPFSRAWPIIEQVARALSFAHGKGIIHSDMKPSNVLVSPGGRIKVIDFGIARSVRRRTGGGVRTTLPGALTPEYASCESLEGQQGNPLDDVYAFGLVVHELLTGRHPFDGLPATEAEQNKCRVKPITGMTTRQNAALSKALAFRRSDRTQSIEDVARALDPSDHRRFAPRQALVVAASLVALSLVATITWQIWFKPAPSEPQTSQNAALTASSGSADSTSGMDTTNRPTPPNSATDSIISEHAPTATTGVANNDCSSLDESWAMRSCDERRQCFDELAQIARFAGTVAPPDAARVFQARHEMFDHLARLTCDAQETGRSQAYESFRSRFPGVSPIPPRY